MLINTIAKLLKIQAQKDQATYPRLAALANNVADSVLVDDGISLDFFHPIFDEVDDDTLAKFNEYHMSNPDIFKLFKDLANQTKDAGRNTYSAKSLMEVIRWNKSLVPGDTFKINNDYTSLYARLLIAQDSSFDGFFELRQIKGLTSKTA